MRHVHKVHVPAAKKEQGPEKRRVKYLYVEADEDHIALQFHEKKGDVKRWKGHGDNGKIIKLVYVHEGYKDEGGEKKRAEGSEVLWRPLSGEGERDIVEGGKGVHREDL